MRAKEIYDLYRRVNLDIWNRCHSLLLELLKDIDILVDDVLTLDVGGYEYFRVLYINATDDEVLITPRMPFPYDVVYANELDVDSLLKLLAYVENAVDEQKKVGNE